MSGHSLSITEADYLERLRAYKKLFNQWPDLYKLKRGPFCQMLLSKGIQIPLAIKSLQDGVSFDVNKSKKFYSDYIDRYIAAKNLAVSYDVTEQIFRPCHILGRAYMPFNEYIEMLDMCIHSKRIKGNKYISIPKVVTDKNLTVIVMDGRKVLNRMYVSKDLDIGNLLWLYSEVIKVPYHRQLDKLAESKPPIETQDNEEDQ